MRLIPAAFFLAFTAVAQQFEIASVRPAEPGAPGRRAGTTAGGRVTFTNFSLKNLIARAWDLRDFEISGGPTWLDQAYFDIVAKPETAVPRSPEGQIMQAHMLQALLAERFGLAFHFETREMPVYELVAAKNGTKLAATHTPGENSWSAGPAKMTGTAMKTSDISKALFGVLGRAVVDRTGLTGEYAVTLTWTPDLTDGPLPNGASANPDGPSLFTAIQEQLGLKLEAPKLQAKKGQVAIFVIDRAEKPTEN